MKGRFFLLLLWLLPAMSASAQDYTGTTGLLSVVSAETDSAGTFRGGFYYLDRRFVTPQFGGTYNTGGYTIGLTAWRWLELSYSATFLKYVVKRVSPEPRYYNEDRHVNVKVVPLYEGKWWPAIALGMDDVGRFKRIKTGQNLNNYYQNIYIVGSKHFDIRGWELGAHLAYRYYSTNKNADRRGVAGGLTLRPAIHTERYGTCHPLRVVAEWDGEGVNIGADALLWRHLFIQAALVHGRGFTGGISYHYKIPF